LADGVHGIEMEQETLHNPLRQFANQKTVSLKTRKRDGTWIATPVSIVVDGDHAYIRTWSGSGKSKRLRNFSDIEIAPSTAGGRPTGDYVSAYAQILTGDEARHAAALLAQKYPLLQRLLVPLFHRIKGYATEHYRVTANREI
jgi:PPOX class probable F420-dependent enzyme